MTQREAADHLGLPRRSLQELEADRWRVEDLTDSELRVNAYAFAMLDGTLTLPEQCYLCRRRTGRRTSDVAAEVGVSRAWLNEMESGREDARPLAAHWGL